MRRTSARRSGYVAPERHDETGQGPWFTSSASRHPRPLPGEDLDSPAQLQLGTEPSALSNVSADGSPRSTPEHRVHSRALTLQQPDGPSEPDLGGDGPEHVFG
jgi:hypothetical protein